MCQQSLAARENVPPGSLEISGVPGVRHVAGMAGPVQQEGQLSLRVAAADAAHVPQVGTVHADEQVKAVIILPPQLPGGLSGAADTVLRQLPPGGGIDGIADLLRAGGSGSDGELLRQFCLADQVLHDKFRHGASADIAVAYK